MRFKYRGLPIYALALLASTRALTAQPDEHLCQVLMKPGQQLWASKLQKHTKHMDADPNDGYQHLDRTYDALSKDDIALIQAYSAGRVSMEAMETWADKLNKEHGLAIVIPEYEIKTTQEKSSGTPDETQEKKRMSEGWKKLPKRSIALMHTRLEWGGLLGGYGYPTPLTGNPKKDREQFERRWNESVAEAISHDIDPKGYVYTSERDFLARHEKIPSDCFKLTGYTSPSLATQVAESYGGEAAKPEAPVDKSKETTPSTSGVPLTN